jgi:hypothetical protein
MQAITGVQETAALLPTRASPENEMGRRASGAPAHLIISAPYDIVPGHVKNKMSSRPWKDSGRNRASGRRIGSLGAADGP